MSPGCLLYEQHSTYTSLYLLHIMLMLFLIARWMFDGAMMVKVRDTVDDEMMVKVRHIVDGAMMVKVRHKQIIL